MPTPSPYAFPAPKNVVDVSADGQWYEPVDDAPSGDAESVPPRLQIYDVRTGEHVSVQFNPEQVKESLAPLWEPVKLANMSHQPLVYQGTGNFKLSFTIALDEMSARWIETSMLLPPSQSGPALVRRFLMSLCHTRKGESIEDVAAPRALLVWPGLYSFNCQLTKYGATHREWWGDSTPNLSLLDVEFEAVSDVRFYSEDVLKNGTIRPDAKSVR